MSRSRNDKAVRYTAPEELARKLDCGECGLILDVRAPEELQGELGHLSNVVNIPLAQLHGRLPELEGHEDRDIVVICRTGKRSEEAARILGGMGFKRISVLKGGMIAWRSHQ
ncbi:MAG: rhodanese-like domain-containing protein [Halobacteriota archaeon]